MRIAHNIPALRASTSLGRANNKISDSTRRLASGVRINSAKDDAAGLAVARKLKLQIDGLERASKNATDGVSLVQTAEGALTEVNNMLQRMRELSVQAANGTLETEDRIKIQVEIEGLVQEITDITDRTEFNSVKVLNGQAARLGVSSNAQLAKVSYVSDTVTPGTLEYTIDEVGLPARMDLTFPPSGAISVSGTLTLNGEAIEISAGDTFSKIAGKIQQAADVVGANVTFDNSTGQVIITSKEAGSNQSLTLDGDNDVFLALFGTLSKPAVMTLNINPNLTAPATAGSFTLNGINIDVASGDTYNDVLEKITAAARLTDATVEFDTSTGEITITSNKKGNNQAISLDDVSGTALNDIFGIPAVSVSENGIGANTSADGTDAKISNVNFTDKNGNVDNKFLATMTVQISGNRVVIGASDGRKVALDLQLSVTDTDQKFKFDGKDVTTGGALLAPLNMTTEIMDYGPLKLQIGPNSGMEMEIIIPELSSEALGLLKLNSQTIEGATDALNKLDTAIADVVRVRSKLGAYQNRLEYTILSLDASAEAAETSRSRIEDTDMAKETTAHTLQNVLAQAGISILAQANQRPQQVLSLMN